MVKDRSILSALHEQVQCYVRLAKLADIQHHCVQNGQTNELIDVLEQRKGILSQLESHETVLAPIKRRWASYLAELDSAERTDAEHLLAQSRTLLEQITASDRNDALILQQQKFNLGRQIGQATSARHLNKTYGAAAYGRPNSQVDLSR